MHTKERQAWCCLQVKLCDPRLSALSVVSTIKALYKYTSFLCFPFTPTCLDKIVNAFTVYFVLYFKDKQTSILNYLKHSMSVCVCVCI